MMGAWGIGVLVFIGTLTYMGATSHGWVGAGTGLAASMILSWSSLTAIGFAPVTQAGERAGAIATTVVGIPLVVLGGWEWGWAGALGAFAVGFGVALVRG